MSELFKEPMVVGRPNIGNMDLFHQLVEQILEKRWLTNYGDVVKELERQLEKYLGVRHCIAVCNATIGLQVVSHALQIRNDALTPSFTFVATPHSLKWEGINPVFVDVDPITHLVDLDSVRSRITEKTTAIVGVHLWGQACYPKELAQLAEEWGLELYFDAAHAFGCQHQGKFIGNFGRCEVFSFHATKFFNTFEGGAIVTNDDELAEKIRLMINFGFKGMDNVISIGANGKMSEVHAAMGLACLDNLDHFLKANRQVYTQYQKRLEVIPGIRLLDYDLDESNCQYIVIEVEEDEFGMHRDDLMKFLHAENIIARRYFYPGCHRMEPYWSEASGNVPDLKETEKLCQSVLVLPGGASLSADQVDHICDRIQHSHTNAYFDSSIKKSNIVV